jgi:hypothetical protein
VCFLCDSNMVLHGLRSVQRAHVVPIEHTFALYPALPPCDKIAEPLLRSFAPATLFPPLRMSVTTSLQLQPLPPLSLGYSPGLQRFAHGYEFEHDLLAMLPPTPTHVGTATALSRVPSTDAFFLQLLALAPTALLSGSPAALQLLHRLGFMLLVDERFSRFGFHVLAMRCLFLSALLLPHPLAAGYACRCRLGNLSVGVVFSLRCLVFLQS